MIAWQKYALCPRCSALYRAPFGSIFHIHFDVCPKCGQPKTEWRDLTNGNPAWEIFTLRFIGTSRIFRPSTWGSGYWQERRGNEVWSFDPKDHIKITESFSK